MAVRPGTWTILLATRLNSCRKWIRLRSLLLNKLFSHSCVCVTPLLWFHSLNFFFNSKLRSERG